MRLCTSRRLVALQICSNAQLRLERCTFQAMVFQDVHLSASIRLARLQMPEAHGPGSIKYNKTLHTLGWGLYLAIGPEAAKLQANTHSYKVLRSLWTNQELQHTSDRCKPAFH